MRHSKFLDVYPGTMYLGKQPRWALPADDAGATFSVTLAS